MALVSGIFMEFAWGLHAIQDRTGDAYDTVLWNLKEVIKER